jgi:hypothetical protein
MLVSLSADIDKQELSIESIAYSNGTMAKAARKPRRTLGLGRPRHVNVSDTWQTFP